MLSLLTIDLSAKRRVYKYIFGPETEEEVEEMPELNKVLIVDALWLVLKTSN